MNIRLNHQQRDSIERSYIAVEEETFANLCQLLDSPPEPSEGLHKLMRVKAPWA